MKILFVLDSLVPAGAETSTILLVRALHNAGVSCLVATLKPAHGPLEQDLAAVGVPHVLLDNQGNRRANVHAVRRLVREQSPDLLHTCVYEADLAGRMAGLLTRTPVVSTLANVAYHRGEAMAPEVTTTKLLLAQAADAATARLVTRFHAVSHTVAAEMQRRLRLSADRIEVIPRGRSRDDLGGWSHARRTSVRARLGLAEGEPVVVAVARQEPQKGLDVLLEAMTHIPSTVRLLVAGRDGRSTEQLVKQIELLGLSERVRFLGARTDVPDILAAADVFAFPSRWEGAAGAMLEAMALQCPIVASDLPTLRETLDDTAARFVPPDDPISLSAALLDAVADRDSARQRAHVAAAVFEDRFAMPAVTQRMLGLYQRALR